ncbi:MAG: hypothetical protein LBT23_01255 [Synergistaceae bacterium]|jgi:hypothetical protein|nr:hypothetical protein [Synergistaceae bacterium]
MGAIKNYYFILGVSTHASAAEINEAYSSRYSTPKTEAEAAMMRELAEARECLADPCRRKEYDDSFGRPEAMRPSGNLYNFSSAESSRAVQYEFDKIQGKQKFKKKTRRQFSGAILSLCCAGAVIFFGRDYFKKPATISDATAALFRVAKSEPREPASQPRVTLETANFKPVVRVYQIKTGGIVTQDRSKCRALPTDSSREVATMRKDAVVFATKEMKDGDGSVWFYVSNSQFEGWARGADVRIYK